MARGLIITTASSSTQIACGAQGECVFTLTSLADRAMLARLRVLAIDVAAQSWLAIAGGDTAELAAGETHQVTVTINPQRAGRFSFHLEAHPDVADGESTIGPAVDLLVSGGAAPKAAHGRFPWLLVVILAVVVLAIGGVGLWLALRASHEEATPTTEESKSTAAAPAAPAATAEAPPNAITAAERAAAERQARAWFEAMRSQNLDQLVAMSPPPFRFDRTVAKDAAEVRRRYQAMATPSSRALFARLAVVGVQVRAATGADAAGDLVVELALRAGTDDDSITLTFHDRPTLRLAGFSQ